MKTPIKSIILALFVLLVCTGCASNNTANVSALENQSITSRNETSTEVSADNSSPHPSEPENIAPVEVPLGISSGEKHETTPVFESKPQEKPNDIEESQSHEHSYAATITKEATCSENGIISLVCACGDTRTEYTEKLPHTFVSNIVAPTDLSNGYTFHTCSKCGYSYQDSYTDKLEHVHNYVLDTTSGVTREVTCENNGYKLYVCACGDSYIDIYEWLMHDFDVHSEKVWVVDQPAWDEIVDGQIVHHDEVGRYINRDVGECKRCGKAYDRDGIVDAYTPNQEAYMMGIKYHVNRYYSRWEFIDQINY